MKHKGKMKNITFLGVILVIIFFLAAPSDITAETYSSFKIDTETSISPPIIKLDNSSSPYALLKGPYNTSALITVQASLTPSNYSDALIIISNCLDTVEVSLEVDSHTNLTRILNATIKLRNETNAEIDQIIIESGQIIQGSPATPYGLKPQEKLYIDIVNLQSNSTGTTYIYAKLKIRIPNKTKFILQTITFKFT